MFARNATIANTFLQARIDSDGEKRLSPCIASLRNSRNPFNNWMKYGVKCPASSIPLITCEKLIGTSSSILVA